MVNQGLDRFIIELIPQSQSYEWGKFGEDGKVARYAQAQPGFVYDPSKPYAELWMGTHPTLPTRLADQAQTLLSDYLSSQPEDRLGEGVMKEYGPQLPFLFKILAIQKALSIQAHPDKALAQRLHTERPEIYKDPNHKPEMAIALTPFSGFCGFRPIDEIAECLRTVPEFAELVGDQVTQSFITMTIDHRSGSPDHQKLGLRLLFESLMKAETGEVIEKLEKLLDRLKKVNVEDRGPIETLIIDLDQQFPKDVGIFCIYVLNLVHLEPGQAMFLSANEPHAYISGDIVECMATSDNVVRAGLTPKLRDVDTLVEMLTYRSGPASSQLLTPKVYKTCDHTSLYDPPIAEFSVLATQLSPAQSDTHPAIDGPSIVIVTDGDGQIGPVEVKRTGQVYFIHPGRSVDFVAGSNGMTCYRAFVEV